MAHVPQPDALDPRGRIETDAIVLDLDDDCRMAARETHASNAGARVPRDVRERVGGNSIE